MTDPEPVIATAVREVVAHHMRHGWPSDHVYRYVVGLTQKALLTAMLKQCRGNQTYTAAALGIDRMTFSRHCKRHGVVTGRR